MRRLLLLASVGLLGAAVAVLPGIATATNPSISAVDFQYQPSQLAITPGGSVDFSEGGYYMHDVHFTAARPSSCTGSTGQVGPSGTSATAPSPSNSSWSGTCTFTQAGTYTFMCDLHHFTGTIYVNSSGTIPGTTGMTTTTTTTTPTGTTTTTTPPAGGGGGGGAGDGAPGAAAASKLVTSAVQHGVAVTGSVTITGAGSQLEAELVGNASQLARVANFGRIRERNVAAGVLRFKVRLSARGRRALRRHHRLVLKLLVKVTRADGSVTSLSSAVTLRR